MNAENPYVECYRVLSLLQTSTPSARGLRLASWLQALSMAEIVSSLPSSGGPYFWAIHLAPKKGRSPAFAGWMTGVQQPLRPAHAFVGSHLKVRSWNDQILGAQVT